jgi:shikimate kinase
MDIKHIIEKIKLEEGVNDPSIFKAVFLAGGPGSGKSFIVGKTALSSLGMRVVNSDPAFEKALQKAGLKMEPDDIWSDAGQAARVASKRVTSKQQSLYVQGRLGLVIDGTGKDYDKISKQKKQLEKLGYETAMIFVNTNLETAVARDAARSRTLGATEVGKMWKGVQDNIGKFQRTFKSKMFIVDNSDGADFERDVMATYRSISAWAKKTPTNKAAKKWIDGQKAKRNITEIVDNEEINEMRDFVSETAEMMMRDMVIMSKKIDELMEAMEAEMARPQMDEFDIEPWIVSKVTKAKDYIDSVYDYAVLDNDEDID